MGQLGISFVFTICVMLFGSAFGLFPFVFLIPAAVGVCLLLVVLGTICEGVYSGYKDWAEECKTQRKK